MTIDDVIERFDGSLAYSTNSKEICQYISDLLKELKERRKAPEIVRCGECKHKNTHNCLLNLWATIFNSEPKDDFFCGMAEKENRMTRDEFMELVYETFADEPDNVLANGIIEAADAYVEHEKAQLSQEGQEGTTKGITADLQPVCNQLATDCISRQATIDGVKTLHDVAWKNWHEPTLSANVVLDMIRELPSAQPEPKEGRWVDGRCNKCGGRAPFWAMASTYYKSDFCPHCGTKMKGETT